MSKYTPLVLLLIASAWARPQEQGQGQGAPGRVTQAAARLAFQCPQKDGFYPDPYQCDKYWECYDGIAEEQLCEDGLVYRDLIGTDTRFKECVLPTGDICGDRPELQPPKSSPHCPRANGFFAHEDPSVCNVFYMCTHGEATARECPGTTHFDEYEGTCTWPSLSYRRGCNTQVETLNDGFNCKNKTRQEVNGLDLVHPRYPHERDCQLFYVCLNGEEPRLSGCPTSTVYNDITMACDDPANVRGCEHWYDPIDYYDEPVQQVANKVPQQNAAAPAKTSRA